MRSSAVPVRARLNYRPSWKTEILENILEIFRPSSEWWSRILISVWQGTGNTSGGKNLQIMMQRNPSQDWICNALLQTHTNTWNQSNAFGTDWSAWKQSKAYRTILSMNSQAHFLWNKVLSSEQLRIRRKEENSYLAFCTTTFKRISWILEQTARKK